MIVAAESEVKKSTCEKYDIYVPKVSGWAKITLCEEDGSVGIVSDYGNWGYLWSHHGRKSLKHFLIEINSHYAWEKFTGAKEDYNHEKTQDFLRQTIAECYDEDVVDSLCEELSQTYDRYDIESSDLLCDHISDIHKNQVSGICL